MLAWRADEIQHRHPDKGDCDHDDGNDEGDDVIGHLIFLRMTLSKREG